MSYKTKFTEDEWELMKKSPFIVFNAVAGADDKIDKKEKKALKELVNSSEKVLNQFCREVLIESSKDFEKLREEFENKKIDAGDLEKQLNQIAVILKEKLDKSGSLIFKKVLIAFGVFIGRSSGSLFGSNLSDEEVEEVKRIGDQLEVSPEELQLKPSLDELLQSLAQA